MESKILFIKVAEHQKDLATIQWTKFHEWEKLNLVPLTTVPDLAICKDCDKSEENLRTQCHFWDVRQSHSFRKEAMKIR